MLTSQPIWHQHGDFEYLDNGVETTRRRVGHNQKTELVFSREAAHHAGLESQGTIPSPDNRSVAIMLQGKSGTHIHFAPLPIRPVERSKWGDSLGFAESAAPVKAAVNTCVWLDGSRFLYAAEDKSAFRPDRVQYCRIRMSC